MKINQFHSGTAVGDAITNQMRLIRKLLLDEGIESEIFAEHIPEELKKEVKPIDTYSGDADSILLVHHSMGFDCFDKIVALPDKKILSYHNITPERFFEDEYLKKYIRKGLQQLKEYRNYVDYAIADSNYNRKDMLSAGYKLVDVMPIQISVDRFESIDAEKNVIDRYKGTTNILFVGRNVQNKCQTDLAMVFGVYHKYFNKESKLILVGDDSNSDYLEKIRSNADLFGAGNDVIIPGKVSEEELKAYYEVADVFLCLSEHEGFGVPLLEAMKMKVPVISFDSSAIRETMGGAGILVDKKNYAYIAALLDEIVQNTEIKNKIIERQINRIDRMEQTDTRSMLLEIINKVQNKSRRRTIQMQGPFETSYSLALVNRYLIETMDELGRDDVSIYCTEGPGDYEPKASDLKDKPHAKALWEKSKNIIYPDVTIRNMFPPRVRDVKGGLNFQAFGWEETSIPKEYIRDFNKYLDGIGTMSDFVTETLKENGCTVPIKTMGIGVTLSPDFDDLTPYSLKTKKHIKFLHISSAFPRKGVDILLDTYFKTFNKDDDVCLVLKTFPNPHNKVGEMLERLRKQYENGPEVEWIDKDLSQNDINSLYKAASCYVQVARGEGFGLPVAEAMLAHLPVIVSPNTGLADFCREETAFLVDYTMVPALTHVTEGDSYWAEPSSEDLKKRLIEFVRLKDDEIVKKKVEAAYTLISKEFTWEAVARRWETFIDEVTNIQDKPDVAMVTTWNNKCGIAEYSHMAYDNMQKYCKFTIYPNYGVELIAKDEPFVSERLWDNALQGDLDELTERLLNSNHEIVNIQFNFGFFDLKKLAKLIETIAPTKKVVITFHKTEDAILCEKTVSLQTIREQLNMCALLIVHQKKDVEVLTKFGVDKKLIRVVTHGQVSYPFINSKYAKEKLGITSKHVIGSYGFLLPHKGILECIKAVAMIKETYPDVLYMPVCSLHESADSNQYFKECNRTIEELGLEKNVKMITDFLANDDSMKYLQACDLLIMAYHNTKESASGAIRFCMAAQRPTITTNQAIFSEVKNATFQINESDASMIADEVIKLWNGELEDEKKEKLYQTKLYLEESSWEKYAETLNEEFRKLTGRL